MALPPIPTISSLPEPPIRGTDTGATFSTKTAAFIDAMHDALQPEINATVTDINGKLPLIETAAEAADYAATAEGYSVITSASADAAQDAATASAASALTAAGSETAAAVSASDADAARILAEAAAAIAVSGSDVQEFT